MPREKEFSIDPGSEPLNSLLNKDDLSSPSPMMVMRKGTLFASLAMEVMMQNHEEDQSISENENGIRGKQVLHALSNHDANIHRTLDDDDVGEDNREKEKSPENNQHQPRWCRFESWQFQDELPQHDQEHRRQTQRSAPQHQIQPSPGIVILRHSGFDSRTEKEEADGGQAHSEKRAIQRLKRTIDNEGPGRVMRLREP